MITKEQIKKAEQCLIDNGIETDEACVVLQALGYILLDTELYEEIPEENQLTCSDCPDDECTGHCASCMYGAQ